MTKPDPMARAVAKLMCKPLGHREQDHQTRKPAEKQPSAKDSRKS